MAKKINYYDISNLLKTNAEYMMLLGQRANGKSYQVKKTVLEEAVNTGKKFIYLRRWQKDINQNNVTAYFDDMPIIKLTKGKYSGVKAYHGSIYFTYIDEADKLQLGSEIGRYCALNEAERYKSQAFVDYKYIVYEEFITDAIYLDDECRRLQQFVSTIARNKHMTVFLIGNTLSRVNPYFAEWALDGVLKMKPGDLELYHYHMDNSTVTVAVEYCKNADADNTMFFGRAAKQIVSGEWDTYDLPKLPQPQMMYDKAYEVCVRYQKFSFILELLVDPKTGGCVVFIYPLTTTRSILRIITDEASDNPFITSVLDKNKRPEAMILDCFHKNKIFYSDNLTGSDFKHVNDALHIGGNNVFL